MPSSPTRSAMRRLPGLRTIDGFHDDPGYIRALARNINDYWMRHGRPERLVMSFHGLPRRSLDLGDPYHCQCQKTARLLATELGLDAKQYVVTFQSRFGRAEWLKPYTKDTLVRLAKDGVVRVDVVCPGFVSDCLETLEEIGIEVQAGVSRGPAAANSTRFPASTSIRTGSPRWSTSCSRISRAGSRCRRMRRPASRRSMRAKAMGARQ